MPATAPARSNGDHLAVLDGLRGLAIVMVVLTHSYLTDYRPALALGPVAIGIEPLVLAGSLGVELFFFISGFVLFAPYARAMCGERPFPTLAHFVERRFLKIVPSYYLALGVVAALFYLPPDVAAARWPQLLAHALFAHTFWHDTMFALVSSFWSLGVEVQFYVVFPAIAAAMRRRPLATYLALLVIGESYRLWLARTAQNRDFFWVSQLPGQIDLFALGMLCAYGYVRYRERIATPRARTFATVVACGAFALGARLVDDFAHVTKTMGVEDHQSWQNDHRLIVSLAIAALALGSLGAHAWWRGLLANPALVWLSGISYNLYLWHDAILVQCSQTGFPCAGTPTPWQTQPHWSVDYFFAYVGISVALAWALTVAFERPLLACETRGIVARARAVFARPGARMGDDGIEPPTITV
ncbi:MAG: hypothetical protein NVS2B3_09640 [Vulcanimicrobiaceae bacterium]